MSLREKILKFNNQKKSVSYLIPQFDNLEVFIKSLKGRDLGKITELSKGKLDGTDMIFPLIILCCVDETDAPIFTMDDLELLKDMDMSAVQNLGTKCMEVNGFINSDDKKKI